LIKKYAVPTDFWGDGECVVSGDGEAFLPTAFSATANELIKIKV